MVSQALCCAGNCLCQAVNNICSDTMKINPKLFSRIGFIILSLVSVAFSIVILFYGANLFSPFEKFIHCPKDNKFDCLGISAVYRMSLALVILHIIVLIFSFCGEGCAKVMNKDCWTFKFLVVIAVYIGLFFVSNDYFIIYAEIAKYISLLFLVYQVIVTISFAHIINISLVDGLDRANENDGKGAFAYKCRLIFLTLFFLGLSLYFIIYSFIYFANDFVNILFISLTIFFGTGFTIISISNFVNRKRLLTSVYLFSYISYLCWSSLNSKPGEKNASSKLSIYDIIFGLIYVVLALSFLGFYIKKKPKINIGGEQSSEEQEAINKNPLLEQEKGKINC